MDDRSIDQLKKTFDHIEEDKKEDAPIQQEPANDQVSPDEQKLHEEIDSLYYGDGVSEYSRTSKRSTKTSATYISKLEKELRAEKEAREKLEKELEEIKKISSEISSHLGLTLGKH